MFLPQTRFLAMLKTVTYGCLRFGNMSEQYNHSFTKQINRSTSMFGCCVFNCLHTASRSLFSKNVVTLHPCVLYLPANHPCSSKDRPYTVWLMKPHVCLWNSVDFVDVRLLMVWRWQSTPYSRSHKRATHAHIWYPEADQSTRGLHSRFSLGLERPCPEFWAIENCPKQPRKAKSVGNEFSNVWNSPKMAENPRIAFFLGCAIPAKNPASQTKNPDPWRM